MNNLANPLEIALRHHQNRELPKAEQYCRQALHADPYNAEAAFLLATVCQAQNKPKDAVIYLEQALRLRPNYVEAHHARALMFAGRGEIDEAFEELRQTLLLKPDFAEAHHTLGVLLARTKRFGEAIAAFRQALQFKFDNPEAVLNLAHACEEKGQLPDAIAAYKDFLQQRPENADTHNALGLVFTKHKQLTQAFEEFQRALDLQPGNAVYNNNLGATLSDQGQPREAQEYFDKAVEINLDYAEAHKNRGMNLLHLGEFERGWQEFEWRWRCKDFKQRPFRQPAWDGSSLNGQRLLLYTEQGIGDTFQFIRYAPYLAERGAKVFLECPGGLAALLKTCPGISQVITHGAPLPEFDCHAPLMSLPRLLGTTLETIPAKIPYLSANKDLIGRWQRELSNVRALKVGIAWQGNPKNGTDYRRSIPLEHFAPLAAVPDVQLFSLQKGQGTENLAKVIGDFPVIDLGGRLDSGSFQVTAAAICNLDLIIACDTACAHLAGALGKPTWVALAFANEWRWGLERNDSPWYPTIRLFRQPKPEDWETVFAQMTEALRELVSTGTHPQKSMNENLALT
jgi:Tfp pilus assembly protein PilF